VGTAAGSNDLVSAFETFVVTSQNNALLNGDYAFQFFGIDQGAVSNSATPGTTLASFGMAGRFHADGNGNLTNVEMDINLVNLVQHFAASTGNYSIAPNERRGVMTLNEGTTGSAIVLRFVLNIDGDGRFIEFDDSNGFGHLGSGVFRLQDPSAFSVNSFKGDFVFGFVGEIPVDRRVAVAGHITSDSAGTISGGSADDNLVSDDTSAINPTSFSAIDPSTGRGTTTWTFASFIVDTGMTSSFAFYIVDATDAYFITTDQRADGGPNSVGQAFLVGEARLQQSGVTSASLNGNTIYYSSDISYLSSPTRTVTPAATVGQAVFQAASPAQGSVTGGRLDMNLGDGLPRHCDISSGSYTLGTSGSAQNGRADVRFSCSDGTARRFIAYLAGPGRGFAIGVHLHGPADQEYGELGVLEPQDLSFPLIDGNYVGASFLPSTSAAPNVSFTYNSTTGSITGTADISDLHGLSPDVDYTGTTAGGGTPGKFDIIFNSPSSTVQGDFTAWLVEPRKFVLLGFPLGGNNQVPVLLIAEQ